jgi:hypothetical protein
MMQLQILVAFSSATLSDQLMPSNRDQEQRPYFRQAVVGLVVAASAYSADFASFDGHLDVTRVMFFSVAALLAGTAMFLTSVPFKKKSSQYQWSKIRMSQSS